MTREEILALEEDDPCPGCPVCEPRLPRRRGRLAAPTLERVVGTAPSGPAWRRAAVHTTPKAHATEGV